MRTAPARSQGVGIWHHVPKEQPNSPVCGVNLGHTVYRGEEALTWQFSGEPCEECEVCKDLLSRTRDTDDTERNLRRAAVLRIVEAEMNRTDENAEGDPAILDYLDDIARHLLTIVEVPS